MSKINSTCFFILFLIFGTGTIFSQDSFTISGTVVDISNNQPIPYATITLRSKLDNKVLKGDVSDENGFFKFFTTIDEELESIRVGGDG